MKNKNKKFEKYHVPDSVIEAVPDIQPFLLKGRNMRKTWEEEWVKMFGVFWTRDYAANDDISDFVTLVRGEIEDNPNVDPAIRFFILK